MIARSADEVIAETDRVSARAGEIPNVGGYVGYYPWTRERRGQAPDPVVTGTNRKMSYNMAISQPVFHWGALHNTTKISELRVKIAQEQTAEAYRLLVGEVRSQYLQLVVKKLGLARARFSQKLADDALALARLKREQNVISESDLFGPTINAEQAHLSTDRVSFDYEISKSLLGKLCGVPSLTDDQIADEIPTVASALTDIDQIVSESVQKGEPDVYYLRNLRRGIEIEDLNYKISAARLKPKVSAVLGTSQDDQVFGLAGSTSRYKIQSMYAGISVSWTIFDGFATRSAKVANLTRRRELERAYKEQSADYLANLKNMKAQFEFSSRSLVISEKLLKSAANGVQVMKDELRRGLTSESAVDAARSAFYAAQIDTFSARGDCLMRIADLLSLSLQDPALANLPSQLR